MTIDEIKRQMFIDSEEVCGNTMIDIYQAQEYVEQAYNNAIDDFVKMAKDHDFKYGKKDITNCVIGFIEFFAEELKAGASNGTDNQ